MAEELETLLGESIDGEGRRFAGCRTRLLAGAELLPLDAAGLALACAYEEQFSLAPQDATMLATVARDAAAHAPAESCFLNANRKDFVQPDVKALLADRGCRLIGGFADGLAFVKTRLDAGATR